MVSKLVERRIVALSKNKKRALLMSMSKWFATAAVCCVCAGCGSLPDGSHRTDVSLEQVILDNKHALTIATERDVFEEFVKYKILHGAFDLYEVDSAEIDVETSIQNQSSTQLNGNFPLLLASNGPGFTHSTVVTSGDTGKLNIKLIPVGSEAAGYKAVKSVFDKDAYAGIYALAAADEKEAKENCGDEHSEQTYCFWIPPPVSKFAYLRDLGALRALEEEVALIPSSKELVELKKNADQGDVGAQADLGSLYENGYGVRQDFELAYFWYGLALKLGPQDPTIVAAQEAAAKHLIKKQIEHEQNQLERWKPKKATDSGDTSSDKAK